MTDGCAGGSSGAAVCRAGDVMAWERGRREGGPRARRPLTCHHWTAGIPCLLYGPGVIRGGADEDDARVLVSEMVAATHVIAVTTLDVCQRAPFEHALSTPPADRFRAAAPRA